MSKSKLFTFSLSFVSLPYNADTAKNALGGEFNPDFREEIIAMESIFGLFQDAQAQCLENVMMLAQNHNSDKDGPFKETAGYKRYTRRRAFYAKILESLKLVSSEETAVAIEDSEI